MGERAYKFWGWGYADETFSAEEARAIALRVSGLTGVPTRAAMAPPALEEIALKTPRLAPPPSLGRLCSSTPFDRVAHCYGKSYRDYVRAFARDFACAPDLVAYPEREADVIALIDWAGEIGAAVIPFGAGSTVVGGIEATVGDRFRGTLTLDLRRMNKVREIDAKSRAARIEAGALGPVLEQQLRPAGFTLRHFPQSFAFSTLGGWIATRSGGHFATLYTHIDDFVESLRVVTPAGVLETRRLPGSGAGPSPDRLFIGSEGALGVITEAWMRVQARPVHRAASALWFDDFERAVEALRSIAQAGLYPANCRLVDAREAELAGAGDGSAHLVVLAFESGDHPVEPWLARALECARDQGGRPAEEGTSDPAHLWREAFIRAPYRREALIAHGMMNDTFETATTWDRFAELYGAVERAVARAIREATGADGHLTCRFTHCYPDGPAPYFTWHAASAPGRELEQWRLIKGAASDALIASGGTITHHHAVGRHHMPWYRQQRPALFGKALEAAKAALDPRGIMNPGVLV